MSAPRKGTWQPFVGAYTAVLPMRAGEEWLVVQGPPGGEDDYLVLHAPPVYRMPGHMVRQALGDEAAPGCVVIIPGTHRQVLYVLGEHHDGEGGGDDWWNARWPD
jgi:hypothetical protein